MNTKQIKRRYVPSAERKNRGKRKKWVIASLSILVLLCGVLTGGLLYGYNFWQNIYKPLPDAPMVDAQSSALQAQMPVTFTQGKPPEMKLVSPMDVPQQYQDQYTNILLILSDGYGNGDLMLLTIDQSHNQLKLTSFLGETWVKIPGLDMENRLDAAYSAGGAKLAAQTLEQNFGVGIDRYVEVDFQQLPALIDSLGGVELTLSQAEADYVNEFSGEAAPLSGAGTYNLSGSQALCHALNRTTQVHDFDSVNRVRDVVMAAFNRFQTTSDMVHLARLVTESTSMLSTDIELDEFSSLLIGSFGYADYETSQYLLPTGDNYEKTTIICNGEEKEVVVIQDMEKVRERLFRFVYGNYHNSGVSQPVDPLYNP